jgi:hypothetical protein
MSSNTKLCACIYACVAPIIFSAIALATTNASAGPCQGPRAASGTQTKCLTAIMIPGS